MLLITAFRKRVKKHSTNGATNACLGDVVRVIRMTRPLILTSVFAGAPTDGHGNHQVSGQMAQEAFTAAADPNRFPEQIREGLASLGTGEGLCPRAVLCTNERQHHLRLRHR